MLLSPPLRSLARHLSPQKIVVDCGGQGQCGPNVISFLLPFVGGPAVDGLQLRLMVISHLAKPRVQSTLTLVQKSGNTYFTIAEFVINCMEHWPPHQRTSDQPSVNAWCTAMSRPQTWIDGAFLQVAADLFAVGVHVTSVDDLGMISDLGYLLPGKAAETKAIIEVGCWVNRHFVAIGLTSPSASASPSSLPCSTLGSSALSPPINYTLTSLAEVQWLLQQPNKPTVLVGFEFSGAMSSALEQMGFVTLSCDFRRSDCDGHYHYQGDVREVLPLQWWDRVYLFLPCFQQLRADQHCLPLKIADGRAYWGCAFVLWCLSCPNATSVIVEQPDTIVYDLLPPLPGVKLVEFRTTQFEDLSDKFVRLAVRNAILPPFRFPSATPTPQPHRSHLQFSCPDDRDRARSSWMPHIRTCAALAAIQPEQPTPTPLPFSFVISLFAVMWYQAGRPLPASFDASDAQPPGTDLRKYQRERGPGNGRQCLQHTHPPVLRPNRELNLLAEGGQSAAYSWDGEQSETWSETPSEMDPRLTTSPIHSPPDSPLLESTPKQHSPSVDLLPAVERSDNHLISLQAAVPAGQCIAALIFICVLMHPLVLVHANGFVITGAYVPSSVKSTALRSAQRLCSRMFSSFHSAFMVGQYSSGTKVFTAPVDFHPRRPTTARSTSERLSFLAKGATLVWCTLASLRGTAVHDMAARSVLAASAYLGPVSASAERDLHSSVKFSSGRMRERSIMQRSQDETGTNARHAFDQMTSADATLREFLLKTAEAGEGWLAEWAERISPFDVSLVPPQLLQHLPDFSDSCLDDVRLSTVRLPLSTSWVPLPPRQTPLPSSAPSCIRSVYELLLPDALDRLNEWLREARDDLHLINASLEKGHEPSSIPRVRRRPLAIGQDELHPWARGRVWDCSKTTQECCHLLDFQSKPTSHLNLSFLRERLEHFPDQALVSHLLEGVKLEADVELHTVLVPHLSSLPLGFSSVDKELRRMQSMKWYTFYKEMPYWPIYLNGQGAASRKLELHRYRRTLEGGGPRTPTFDRTGLRAVSLNEASRVYHMPAHFLSDTREEFIRWLSQRGLPALQREPQPIMGNEHAQRLSKWPKERKPQLVEVMRDISVLRRAAEVLQTPSYSFGDDAKDYFNQLAMAPCEYPKLGIAFLARGDEAPGIEAGDLFYVTEKQLPFGLHPASNVAQRFSDALLDVFRAKLDTAEWELNQHANAHKTKWLTQRLALQNRLGEPCVPTDSRFEHPSNKRPEIPAPSRLKDIPQGYVCPQLRLYSAHMFTDDPQFVTVSPELTLAALRAWREVTSQLGLIMAIPEKRSLGSWSRWIGVFIVVSLGLVVVPRDKILKASVAVTTTLQGGADFRLYRALCGLLEHLRAINLRKGDVMYGLYQPHSREGASRFGPAARIVCSTLMKQQLARWQTLLSQSCAVSVKRALLRHELELDAQLIIEVSSDACLGDEDPPGMGGFCHGLFWNLPVPEEDQPLVTIPLLELMGALFNVIVLYPFVRGAIRNSDGLVIRLRTDALATAYGLAESSIANQTMAAAYLKASETEAWQQLLPFLRIEHIFGDANPMADAASRQQWAKLSGLCTQLGIKAQQIEVPFEVLKLYEYVLNFNRELVSSTLSAGSARLVNGGGDDFDAGSVPGDPQLLAKLRHGTAACLPESPCPSTSGSIELSALFLAKLRGSPSSALASPPKADKAFSPQPFREPHLSIPASSARAPQNSLLQAKNRVSRALHDESAMGFTADADVVVSLAEQMASTVEAGINANTAKIESRAWEMWVHVCHIHGTSPHRTPQDVIVNPDRTAHLLSCLLLHAYAVGSPKNKSCRFIKPDSAMAYPLAIIRIFSRWGIAIPNYKFVNAHLLGLKSDYIRIHGPQSLAPRRAEPMKFAMVRHVYHLPEGTRVADMEWSDTNHLVFVFKRLCVFMIYTAFRIGEICEHTSRQIRFITFSCLTWRIAGVIYTQPTIPLLLSMKPGRDVAFTTPSVSKPDQHGEIHCPFPVVFTFEDTACNPAKAVRDLEIKVGCQLSMDQRRSTPLFPDKNNNPYTYAVLHSTLRKTLSHCYGEPAAKLYSWHSFRSGLATALHAAGVEDSMIQLICRWMCPESLHVYRRMGIREHEKHINKASLTNVDSIQSANIPIIDRDLGYSQLLDDSYLEPARRCSPSNELPTAALEPTPIHTNSATQQTAARRAHASRKTKRKQAARDRSTELAVQPPQPKGVGSTTHKFPPTLAGFTTFFNRPSSRHPPTRRRIDAYTRQGDNASDAPSALAGNDPSSGA